MIIRYHLTAAAGAAGAAVNKAVGVVALLLNVPQIHKSLLLRNNLVVFKNKLFTSGVGLAFSLVLSS